MAVLLHGDTAEVVESEIELADNYTPEAGQWFYHTIVHGLMMLGPVIYDGSRNAKVLTTAGAAYDYTSTLEEWLKIHPGWNKAEIPFISSEKIKRDIEDDNGY